MANRRDLRTERGTRKVIPDLWESVMQWDVKTSERLERIGIRKPTRKQTRGLLAQAINELTNDAEFEPIKDMRRGRRFRVISLVLRRK